MPSHEQKSIEQIGLFSHSLGHDSPEGGAGRRVRSSIGKLPFEDMVGDPSIFGQSCLALRFHSLCPQLPAALDATALSAAMALRAMRGRLVVGKVILIFFHPAGRSCHAFGLFTRHLTWPLTIMLSADRVPVNCTRSTSALAQMDCPGLWADWHGCVIRSKSFPTW